METTIDIPDDVLKEAMETTGAASPGEAVVAALRGFIRYRELDEIADLLGTFKDFMTADDLMDMRHERGVYAEQPDDDRHVELDRIAAGKRSA